MLGNSNDFSKLNHELGQILNECDENFFEVSNIKNLIQCQNIHLNSFAEYKRCFEGKTVVLVGAGPTAKRHVKKNGAIYVGVNNACLLPQVQMDYLFCQDFYMDEDKQKSIVDYHPETCTKFFGIIPDNRMAECRRVDVAKHVRRCPKKYFSEANAKTYYIYDLYRNKIAMDIENEPLIADGIIFCAMQFVLHGHPKRIYLVGCDCTSGFFYESDKIFDNTYMIEMWKNLKSYIDEFYFDIEIYSINPVGLKGLFLDVYE